MKDNIGCFKIGRLRKQKNKCPQTYSETELRTPISQRKLLSNDYLGSNNNDFLGSSYTTDALMYSSNETSQSEQSGNSCYSAGSDDTSTSLPCNKNSKELFNNECFNPINTKKIVNVPPTKTLEHSDTIPKERLLIFFRSRMRMLERMHVEIRIFLGILL